MITLAFPGLKPYCEITYNHYRNISKDMGMSFDDSGELREIIERKAREDIFSEYLDKMRANGQAVELFDV